jgi:hypothetical protein
MVGNAGSCAQPEYSSMKGYGYIFHVNIQSLHRILATVFIGTDSIRGYKFGTTKPKQKFKRLGTLIHVT